MATKIRLQRHGRKGRPYYKIVVADARAKRDGKFIEKLGSYNPTSVPATIEIDRDRALEWLLVGAQPTDTVKAILKFKGVLYKKHLLRGVEKGALTAEEAEEKFQAWLSDKESKVLDRQNAQSKKEAERVKASVEAGKEKAEAKRAERLAANEPVVEAEEAPAVEAPAEVTEEAPATEEPVAEVEATEEKAEEPVAEATEEAPVAEAKEESSEEDKA